MQSLIRAVRSQFNISSKFVSSNICSFNSSSSLVSGRTLGHESASKHGSAVQMWLMNSVRSPFSTVPSGRRKRKSTRKVDEKPKEYILDDFIDEKASIDDGTNPPILVSPLVQVFSVSVHTNFDDERPCELYGSIRATGTMDFTLYDRNRDNPETIILNKHGNNYLSLSGPRPQHGNDEELSCSLSATTTKIELDLKDKTQNDMELIKSHLILDYNNTEEIEDSYDKAVVVGAEHFALLHYATFWFAVLAYVEVAIFAKYDELSRPVSEIYGSIVAGYSNCKSYNSSSKSNNSGSIKCSTLFNRPQDEPLPATVSTPFRLSRYAVAVPVHSFLKIEARLWDRYNSDYSGPFASGFVEFFGPTYGFYADNACTKLIRGEGGSVVVSVTWDNAFEHAQELRDFEGEVRVRRRRELEREGRERGGGGGGDHPCNDNEALMLQNKPALPSSTRALTLDRVLPRELVEVYSVFVDSKANEVPTICGFVQFEDGERNCIFEHDISDPHFYSPNKRMIPLGVDSPTFFDPHFGIKLFLKDPISGGVISNGACGCDGLTFGWYDKHLCSVIPGTHGYAAVHYIVLRNACIALIEITIIDDDLDISARARSSTLLSPPSFNNNNNNNNIHVHGCIFAQYKSHDYSSVYAKKYYRSRLFDKPESESVELTMTHPLKLPLLKSVVNIPIDDSLIVEANLYATRSNGNGNPKEEALFGTVEFEVDGNVCTLYKRIQRQRYCIQISMELTY